MVAGPTMSDTCSHPDCVWQMPANTPDILTSYVADQHRAYECPQLETAPDDAVKPSNVKQ